MDAQPRHAHAVPAPESWSLLRLSAAARLALAAVLCGLLWAATLAVIL